MMDARQGVCIAGGRGLCAHVRTSSSNAYCPYIHIQVDLTTFTKVATLTLSKTETRRFVAPPP